MKIDNFKNAIRVAMEAANAVTKDLEDNGTCNFDLTIVEKVKGLTYADMVCALQECGIYNSRKEENFITVPHLHGQAQRNTIWHQTFASVMKRQGYNAFVYYIVD